MGFSFNWQGFSVPQASRRDTMDRVGQEGAAWGQAARGFLDRRRADRAAAEYADIMGSYGKGQPSGPDTGAIRQEIMRLKARNAEIARQLGL